MPGSVSAPLGDGALDLTADAGKLVHQGAEIPTDEHRYAHRRGGHHVGVAPSVSHDPHLPEVVAWSEVGKVLPECLHTAVPSRIK